MRAARLDLISRIQILNRKGREGREGKLQNWSGLDLAIFFVRRVELDSPISSCIPFVLLCVLRVLCG
jgi:hypothetical protein